MTKKAKPNTKSKQSTKKVNSKLDANTYFRQKISNSIYSLSGIRFTEDLNDNIVVLLMEKKLKSYICSILRNIVKRKQTQIEQLHKGKRKRKKQKLNDENPVESKQKTTIRINDIYEELNDTLEYYGVKRCVILKRISTSLEKKKDDVAIELDVVTEADVPVGIDAADAVSDDDTIGLDLLQQQLRKLDDGSRLYLRFEKQRLINMQIADQLTQDMSLQEYLEYNTYSSSKFIDNSQLFHQWLDLESIHINKELSKNIYIALGWLCVNKIRLLLTAAISRRAKHVGNPFYSPQSHDRILPLHHSYLVESENDEEYLLDPEMEEIQERTFFQMFMMYDNKFKSTSKNKAGVPPPFKPPAQEMRVPV